MKKEKLAAHVKTGSKLKTALEKILAKHLVKEEVTPLDALAGSSYGYDTIGPQKDLVKYCICPVCKTYVEKDNEMACSMHQCPKDGSAMVNKMDARVEKG
jgi:hypothetical protein